MSGVAGAAMGRACGKVILLGEHAVVHGAPALATALPLELRVEARRRPGPLALSAPGWGLDATAGDGTREGEALARLASALGIEPSGALLHVETEIPARAGLGSSAALAAAAARALVAFCGIDIDHAGLFAAVQASERIFHGNPSGLDAEVALGGRTILFSRAQGALAVAAPSLPLAVIHSGRPRETGAAVARFAGRLAKEPAQSRALIERIGDLARDAAEALGRGDLARLGRAMNENHEHLVRLGVSTAELDRICALAIEAGALGAKLTGGGGGGCAVILLGASGMEPARRAAEAGFCVVFP